MRGESLRDLLVGDPPITGKTIQSVIAKLLTEAPTRIRTVRPTVAEDRFSSTGEFMPSAVATPATPQRKARNVGIMIGAAATVTLLVALGANGKLFGRVDTSAALRERTQLTFSGQVSAPTVSQDGKQLAYFTKECAGARCTDAVDVQDVGATVTRRVLEGASADYGLERSPDRRNLLIVGTIGGRYGVFIVSALGGQARLLTSGAATFFAGGDSLLIGSSAATADSNFIVRVALDGSTGKLATHQDTIFNGRFSNLSVTADGTQMTVDDGSFDYTVVAAELPAVLRGALPADAPLLQASSPVFGQISPDGNETPLSAPGSARGIFWTDSVTAVLATSTATGTRFSLLDVRTSAVLRSLDLEGAPPAATTLLPDGWAWIPASRDRIIVEQDGKRHEIAAPAWFRSIIDLDASADGSRLVYAGWNISTEDTLRVDVVPTSGGAAVPWVRRFAETGGAQWMNDGLIAFVDWTGPESVTLFKVTAPDQVQALGEVPRRAQFLTLSRDDKRATMGWRSDAWMYRVVKP